MQNNTSDLCEAGLNGKPPNEEQVVSLLQRRFRRNQPYTSLGARTLCVVNPFTPLDNDLDSAAAAIQFANHTLNPHAGEQEKEPHPYAFAGRVFQVMALTKRTQAVVYNGFSGSGKSYTSRLVTQQLLRLGTLDDAATPEFRLADKVRALEVLLDSFGHCKTTTCASASQYARFFELHFRPSDRRPHHTDATAAPTLAAAQLLPLALNKTRVAKPQRDERTFNVFYQLLAGASTAQREELALKPSPSDYALMASSASSNPRHSFVQAAEVSAAERAAYDDLVAAFTALHFKPKHVNAIFRLLSAILLLSNLTFAAASAEHRGGGGGAAHIEPDALPALELAAALLGIPAADDLARVLTHKSRFVQKDRVTYVLDPAECAAQRDALSGALYAIVFAYICETGNARLYPGQKQIAAWQAQGGSSIVQFDAPGFQSRSQSGPGRAYSFIQSFGDDRFAEFCANSVSQELLQHWLYTQTFDDAAPENTRMAQDGVQLIPMELVDRSVSRLELLRGGVLGGRADTHPGGILGGLAKTCSNVRKGKVADKSAGRAFLEQMRQSCKAYPAFVAHGGASNGSESSMFGIQHFGGNVSYDASDFVDKALDLVDADFVPLLRSSDDAFVARLLSGPGLAVEEHPVDPETTLAAQISSQPLRQPSPLQTAEDATPADGPTEWPAITIAPVSTQINTTLSRLLKLMGQCQLWTVHCVRPNASFNATMFEPKGVQAQISAAHLAQTAHRRSVGCYVADFSPERVLAFLGISEGKPERLKVAFEEKGVQEGADYFMGTTRVWLGPKAFNAILQAKVDAASAPRLVPLSHSPTDDYAAPGSPTSEQQKQIEEARSAAAIIRTATRLEGNGRGRQSQDGEASGTYDSVPRQSSDPFNPSAPGSPQTAALGDDPDEAPLRPRSTANNNPFATPAQSFHNFHGDSSPSIADKEAYGDEDWAGSEAGKSASRAVLNDQGQPQGDTDVEFVETSRQRRVWLALVFFFTWFIPEFTLKHVGRMKRPDVRQAWREKFTICALIFLLCALVVFYIIGFGLVLCPEYNHVWNTKELGYHQGKSDFWVAVRGEVYDITHFWRAQHSDIDGQPVYQDQMMELAGQDLSNYFPPPLSEACPDLVTDDDMELLHQSWTADVSSALHTSGNLQSDSGTALKNGQWLWEDFYPYMKQYHKGPLVYSRKNVSKTKDEGSSEDSTSITWGIYKKQVFDLTDYLYTLKYQTADKYEFLDSAITEIFESRPGEDVTEAIDGLSSSQISQDDKDKTLACMKELFYKGRTDPRDTPRCEAQPYMLLAFSILIITVLAVKFLASLQFTTKRVPEPRDKFAILQVPCYTEGEESLRKTIESLAKLKYDDKRKLLFIICDGMIVGSGNDKPTPRIVLDILGASAHEVQDPDPVMFKSVGEGSKQINYGKVYSGLYEHEGHVVPYLVVAKVGKPSERSKPGNRGKRDSQVLLMRFLNRVHEDSEMAPLELEMYHQIKDIIGVDPAYYEYMLCVDADTEVHTDSLNRLIAVSHDDQQIFGLCGETKISNERTSLTTMIQVYEYFISHHMAKAFESLFGSVTCLPGCFTLYRIRTHEGKPLLAAKEIIDDYAENHVDTLHKKNLLSLGEDRYLTTLILKHFPHYKTKFTQDALAYTSAPDSWSVLLSQRRRWINSTVHNLVELLYLNDMCGTCCFSMRFVVMLDLVSTLILPATTVYLVYLIVSVAMGSSSIPLLSIIMLAAVYGLQVIIFLLKREWAFIGWLIIYLMAYPLYSFLLPIYSWWHFDDFSWGNTRVVVGEGKNRKVLAGAEEEPFDDSMIPMRKWSDYQAQVNPHLQHPGMAATRAASFSGLSAFNAPGQQSPTQYAGSVHGMPLGANNVRGSTYSLPMYQNEMPQRPASHMSGSPYGAPTAYPGSMLGMPGYTGSFMSMTPPNAPWATPRPTHSPTGSYGGGSAYGGSEPGTPPIARPSTSQNNLNRPMSTFSQSPSMMMGGSGDGNLSNLQHRQSTMSMFSHLNMPTVSDNPNPSNSELRTALRGYLATQDLMSVTKRTTRQAVAALFPRADLTSRKDFMSAEIDAFCSGQ